MPRGTRKRANARPDSRIGGRRVMSRGGVVAERPGRSKASDTADALASISGVVNDYAQRQAAEQEREEAKQQRLQAFKDFHSDAANGVSLEHAQQRAAFGNDSYSRTYQRMADSQRAREESADLQQQYNEWVNDPDVGIDEANQRLDAHVSGLVQGLDDPASVDIYANRLSSEAEELKLKGQQVAIQRQQADGQAKFNAHLDDLSENNLLGSSESIEMLERTGADLNMTQSQVHKSITAAAIRSADQSTDPSKLDFLFREDEDGVSLADDPAVRDKVLRARQKIEADKEQQVSAEDLDTRYNVAKQVDGGVFGLDDAKAMARRDPGKYTEAQLTSWVMQSQRNARRAAQERREQARLASSGGGEAGVRLRQMTASKQRAYLDSIYEGQLQRYGDSPEGREQARLVYAAQLAQLGGGVSGISENVLGPYLNSGATTPSPDGSPPEGFNERFKLWQQMGSDPAMRGVREQVTRSGSRRIYERVQQLVRGGDYVTDANGNRDITPAYAKAQQQLENPLDEGQVRSSQAYNQLTSAVDDVSDVGGFLGIGSYDVKNAAEVMGDIKQMALEELRYTHGDYEAALESAKERYTATHTLVKGTYVRGNYGSDATEAVNANLEQHLPAIRESTGPGVNSDDLSVMGDDQGRMMVFTGSQPALVPDGRGGTKPLVIDMNGSHSALQEKYRAKANAELPTASDAENGGASERPSPAPGSPATATSNLDSGNAEDRETFRKQVSDALGSLMESLSGPGDTNAQLPGQGNP